MKHAPTTGNSYTVNAATFPLLNDLAYNNAYALEPSLSQIVNYVFVPNDGGETLASSSEYRDSSVAHSHHKGFYKDKGIWKDIIADARLKLRLRLAKTGWWIDQEADYLSMEPVLSSVLIYYRDVLNAKYDNGET